MRRKTERLKYRTLDMGDSRLQEGENSEKDYLRVSELDFKQLSRQKRRKRRKRAMICFLVLLFVCVGVFLFLRTNYFNIKEIKVEGSTYYTEAEIISMSRAETGRNIVFDSGKADIEELLESNAYFKNVTVKRKLPSTLVIQVEERPQIAAVEFGDSFIVIDDEGVILRKTDVDPKITLLTGLTISKLTIGEQIEAEEKETLAMTLRMLNTMENGDMYFKKIDVEKVVIRAYIYDNLIVKGTPSEVTEAIETGQLQKVVSDLFDQNISRGTIVMGGASYMSFSPELDAD